jgi:hypothetical protein
VQHLIVIRASRDWERNRPTKTTPMAGFAESETFSDNHYNVRRPRD